MITTLLVIYLVSVVIPLLHGWYTGDDIDVGTLIMYLIPIFNTFLLIIEPICALREWFERYSNKTIIKGRKQ